MTQRGGLVTAAMLPAIVALIVFEGCSVGALDGFSGGEVPSPDGGAGGSGGSPDADGPVDASGDVLPGDGSEPDAGAGVNLLSNADFELGCAGWKTTFGFITEGDVARNGTRSCKFCMDTNWETFLEQTVTVPVKKGETYFASDAVTARRMLRGSPPRARFPHDR